MQRGRARHPDADRGDLAGRADRRRRAPTPRSGRRRVPVARPEAGAHRDQRFLKAPNEFHHVERLGQADDRIADQLAGAVPGDLAAAVGVDDGGARRPAARAARCACPRCRPADARAAAGCRGRRRRGRRPARAAAARPSGSRRCPSRRTSIGVVADRIDAAAMASTLLARSRCPSARSRRPAPRRWCCGGTRNPARSSAAGMARCPPSRPSSANSPSTARSANPGTSSGVGRFTARPSAAVNSALVTGAGPVRFTGPATSSCPIANSSARTSSSRLIHGMYWRPLPSRAPSPSENSGLSRPSMPPDGRQHQAGAHQHHPGARPAGRVRWPPPSPRTAGRGSRRPAARSRRRRGRGCRRSSRPRWR